MHHVPLQPHTDEADHDPLAPARRPTSTNPLPLAKAPARAPEPPGAQERLDDIPVAACAVPPREAYRVEWFQTPDVVEVAVLASTLH